MVFIRTIAKGVKSHFHIRVSEWVMVFPALGMWLAFQLQPNMFDTSPSFETLRHWGNEQFWAFLCLMCAVARLGALVINGTYKKFPWSPHIRFGASVLGACFWSQYALGFVDAAVDGKGAWSPVIAYSTFVLFELMNVFRSRVDIATAK